MCAQDAWGRTALHWAAAYACEASVVLLLVRGAHAAPLSHGTEAQPPLAPGDMAAAAGHIGLAAFLAEHALVQLMKDHNVSLEDPMATSEFLTHLWTLLHHNILGSAAEAEKCCQFRFVCLVTTGAPSCGRRKRGESLFLT